MSASLRFCAFWAGVVLAARFSPGGVSLCAQPIEMIALTNFWRYEQSGADLGSAWKETAYNDAAWPEGRGVLAAEAENPIVWALTNFWHYEQSGADLGSAWKETAYNDAAWPEGRGVLAAEAENP